MTLLDSAPPTPENLESKPGTLEIRNLSKAFPNVQALKDVSLDIRPGEILAFMGENGAGKSTFIKIITGVYQPDSGEKFVKDFIAAWNKVMNLDRFDLTK